MSVADAAVAAAQIVCEAFEVSRQRHSEWSLRAGRRFETRDWAGLHEDAVARLDAYPACVADALRALEARLGTGAGDADLWHVVRSGVVAWLEPRADASLGATFYNSVVRRALASVRADPHTEILTAIAGHDARAAEPIAETWPVSARLTDTVRHWLEALGWRARWDDLAADAHAAAEAIDEAWRAAGHPPLTAIEALPQVFYRGTRAFVVGRLLGGSVAAPITIAIRHDAAGVAVDAVLLSEDAVSIVFSFTRAYFHVDDSRPDALVGFLHRIMPRKPLSELYTALGFFKHGKTLLYRDLVRHIGGSSEAFVMAPGAKGMVMAAFVLPSLDVVFKVIRDEFAPPKTTTRRDVMERYALVFKHDRAGRLVDAQEFEHLSFPRDRLAPELHDELHASCGSMLRDAGRDIEIRHLYTERRLVPLDLYLSEASPRLAEDAIVDYGLAIKDLAAANIFPGDLLLKNFGVTRHKRVVFYDYDELCPLDACRFRRLPPARHDEDELSAEPWFHVGENDVFPEEFLPFLAIPAELKPLFLSVHGDLLDPAFWQAMQARHAAGDTIDILPYRESHRLRRTAVRP